MSQVELMSFRVERLSEQSDLRGLTLQERATKSQGFNLSHLKSFCLHFVLKWGVVTCNWCLRLPLQILDLNWGTYWYLYLTQMPCNYWSEQCPMQNTEMPQKFRFKTWSFMSKISETTRNKTTALLLQVFSPFKQSKACWVSSNIKLSLAPVGHK